MKNFTVICIRFDNLGPETQILHILASTPAIANECVSSLDSGYTIVAILPGWHNEA